MNSSRRLKPAVPAARPRNKRAGNRERIVEAAIELLNARGNLVGTSQVAAHLGISHGNLYYHFSDMQAIVLEILARLHDELGKTLALRPGEVVDVERLVGFYSNGARVLWRYRFMVSSALELTAGNAELENNYRKFTSEGIDWVYRIICNVVKHHPGPISARSRDCRHLADNMWVLWNGWPRHAEHYRVDASTSPAAIAHGLELIAMTLAPYVVPEFHNRVRRGLSRFVASLKRESD